MSTTIGLSAYPITIPDYDEPADIQAAFKLLHYGSTTIPANTGAIAGGIAKHLNDLNTAKAPLASPTFTGTVDLSGATVSLPSAFITSANIVDGTLVNADISSSAAIAVSKLAASSVTIGSTSVTLGNTAATIAGLTLTLPTIGGTGAKFNGSTSGTVSLIASATAGSNTITIPATTGTMVTTGDTATVTNTMLAGSIANSKLSNSVISINGTQVALGGSIDLTTSSAGDILFDQTGFVANSILYNSTYNTTENLAPGTSSQILGSSGTTPTWTQISNTHIASNAAIAYSKLNLGTSITNSDIATNAAIADTKLATISTPLKVSNAATTATSLNTASAIVARDGSGNFTAGTITATLNGNASTATSATKAVAYSAASSTYPSTPLNRIYVGSVAPASPEIGDIWMW